MPPPVFPPYLLCTYPDILAINTTNHPSLNITKEGNNVFLTKSSCLANDCYEKFIFKGGIRSQSSLHLHGFICDVM